MAAPRFDDLSQAVRSRQPVDAVRDIIERGTRTNPEFIRGRTPAGNAILHVAASNGFPELTQLLVDMGADVNARDFNGNDTPLRDALNMGHFEDARIILASPQWIFEPFVPGGNTPLLTLVCERLIVFGYSPRDFVIIDRLLEKGSDINENQGSALRKVLTEGPTLIPLLEKLLSSGADPNLEFSSGKLPLQVVCTREHTLANLDKILNLLLAAGAIPSLKNSQGVSSLDTMSALRGQYRGVVARFITNVKILDMQSAAIIPSRKATSFLRKIPRDVLRLVPKYLAESREQLMLRVAIEARDWNRARELLPAVESVSQMLGLLLGNVAPEDVFRALLSKSSEEEKNKMLHGVIYRSDIRYIPWLIEGGADVNAEDFSGTSVLAKAIEYESLEAIQLLIDSERLIPKDEDAIITRVCEKFLYNQEGKLVLLQQLLDAGYHANEDNDWPLKVAISWHQYRIVNCLLDHGAGANTQFRDGSFPLNEAGSNLQMVHILLDHGADPSKLNGDEEDAIAYCRRMTHHINLPSYQLVINAMEAHLRAHRV